MQVLGFRNLEREESHIFYLRKYTCNCVLELPTSTIEPKLLFSIETTPLGERNVDLSFTDTINYPVIPVKKAIREYILQADKEGRLPC
ncbi:MAG: hypothetical protein HUK25_07070 [Treponema sp.]|nr:hypothetical protein [Treponema sp.]